MTLSRCAACGRDRTLGELVRVQDRAGIRPDALLCRPTISLLCLRWAGHAGQTVLAMADPAAAREFDRRRTESPPDPAYG